MKVENLTVPQIKDLVEQGLQSVVDGDVREALGSVWADITRPAKKPTKGVILDFYYEMKSM